MIEQRLPVLSRWVLYALGASEGKKSRRPVDPVAAWLLQQHSFLLPTVPQPALLLTIRARYEVVDRLMEDEIHVAGKAGTSVALWTFGAGFDARWWRYGPRVSDAVREWREVESPGLLELKQRLLAESPYAESWSAVVQKPLPEDKWTTADRSFFRSFTTIGGTWRRPSHRPLVVFEAGPHRVAEADLRTFLARLRGDAPEARVICGLPIPEGNDKTWRQRGLAELGWRIDEDIIHTTRGRLMGRGGGEVVPGMYGFRIARLVPREPLQ